ncbi:MAG: 16S rRNA (guanine(966)-N(2))-methyltransferase RsmD [Deltaproteobacteria bacterium]|nr:16S rRNA (guanine(966)-N(2))-methyltransferase RsmD [Deltaproteobacteria bacterium]
MRIVGGEWRGRRIHAPRSPRVRPTAERVREAIFDLLGQRLEGQRVLDLFAGSGALGIEALSRGARYATFVERDRAAVQRIRANLELLAAGDRAEVVGAAVASFVARRSGARYDTVFADPPYLQPPAPEIWSDLVERWLAPGGRLVIESAVRSPVDVSGLAASSEQRCYGDSAVTIVVPRRGV